MSLIKRVAVVTGGTRGIGKAVAVALASQGAQVVVIGRNEERTVAVANELNASMSCVMHNIKFTMNIHSFLFRITSFFKLDLPPCTNKMC
jgi:NAD(P)-dependent dehydrogenase (short-subunit alcohol dehydrogenase family)